MRTSVMTLALAGVIVVLGLKGVGLFVKADATGAIAEEFQLPREAAAFVLECLRNDEDFGFDERTTKRRFCGCVGADLDRSLDGGDVEAAAWYFEQNREKGIAIPSAASARTSIAARVANGLASAMGYCRSGLG